MSPRGLPDRCRGRLPGLTMKATYLIVAVAVTVVMAASPSVAATPALARCAVVYQHGQPTVSPHAAGRWHVEACIFDEIVHGRTVAQVGTENINPPVSPPKPLSCEATKLGSWPGQLKPGRYVKAGRGMKR